MTRDPLLDRIAALWRTRDPMPPDLPERVLARLAADGIDPDLDAEYELLTLAGRSDALLGARSGEDSQVLLEFHAEGCTVLLRVTVEGPTRRIDGWCEPAALVAAQLTRGGDTWPAEVRAGSRFVLTGVPPGLCRLILDVDTDHTTRRLRSPQVEI